MMTWSSCSSRQSSCERLRQLPCQVVSTMKSLGYLRQNLLGQVIIAAAQHQVYNWAILCWGSAFVMVHDMSDHRPPPFDARPPVRAVCPDNCAYACHFSLDGLPGNWPASVPQLPYLLAMQAFKDPI